MARDNGALVDNVQLQIECAKILQERSLVFQISGLLTSGSFNCGKKKVLYFEQNGSSLLLCVETPVNDVKMILRQSTGRM